LQVQDVDDVRLLDGALNRADPLSGGEIGELGDRRACRHHERVVAEVVAVGEGDGAPPRVGGLDVRRTDVEAPGRHLGEQPGEIGGEEAELQAQLVGNGTQQLVVEAGELSSGVYADVRWGIRQRSHRQHARRAKAQRADVHLGQRLGGSRRVAVVVAHTGILGEVLRQDARVIQPGWRTLVPIGARGRSRCDQCQTAHHQDCRGQSEHLSAALGAPAYAQTHRR
jgi:hypothetical protein